jgi:hypothetical protein
MYLRDVIATPLQHHLENNSNASSISSLASPPDHRPLYRNAIAQQTSLGISHSKNFSSSSSMQDRVNLQRSFGNKNIYNTVSPFTDATSSKKKRKSPPSSLNFRAYNNDLSKGYLRRSTQRSSPSTSFSRDSIEDVDKEDAPMRTPKRTLMGPASPPKNSEQQDLCLECLRRMRKGDATTKQAAVLLYKILTGTA